MQDSQKPRQPLPSLRSTHPPLFCLFCSQAFHASSCTSHSPEMAHPSSLMLIEASWHLSMQSPSFQRKNQVEPSLVHQQWAGMAGHIVQTWMLGTSPRGLFPKSRECTGLEVTQKGYLQALFVGTSPFSWSISFQDPTGQKEGKQQSSPATTWAPHLLVARLVECSWRRGWTPDRLALHAVPSSLLCLRLALAQVPPHTLTPT